MTDRDRIAEFKEVAELMPDDPVVRFGLAGAYLDAGLAEEAVAEYREAVRLKPDYTAAYRGLGRALERAGRLDEARAAYGRGLEVARQTGDLQTGKEIEVFLRRLGPRPWLGYTPPARRDPSDRRHARAAARARVSPPAVAPRDERARGGRLRGGGRVLLHALSVPGGRGVPLGGGRGAGAPPLAAARAPRRGHRAHVGVEGHAPVEEARVLRKAPQGPAAPRGPRAVPRLLRAGSRTAAGARVPRRVRGGADVAHGAPPDGRAGPGAPAVHARTAGEHVHARALEDARVRAGDGRAPAGALGGQDRGAVRADVLLPLGLGGGVAARGRRGGPATLSRAGAGAAARALHARRDLQQRAPAGAPVRAPAPGGDARGGPAGRDPRAASRLRRGRLARSLAGPRR